METDRSIRNATGNILDKNTEMLKQHAEGSETQQQLLEIAELKDTHKKLLSAIEETIAVQVDGNHTRQKAETELFTVEQELKTVLQPEK